MSSIQREKCEFIGEKYKLISKLRKRRGVISSVESCIMGGRDGGELFLKNTKRMEIIFQQIVIVFFKNTFNEIIFKVRVKMWWLTLEWRGGVRPGRTLNKKGQQSSYGFQQHNSFWNPPTPHLKQILVSGHLQLVSLSTLITNLSIYILVPIYTLPFVPC